MTPLAPTHPAYSLRGEILCLLSGNKASLSSIVADLGLAKQSDVRREILKLIEKKYPVTLFTDPSHGRCVRVEASTRGDVLRVEAETYYRAVYGEAA